MNNYAALLRKYKESVNSIMGEMSDSLEYAPVFVVVFWCRAHHKEKENVGVRLYEASNELFCNNPDMQDLNELFVKPHRLYERVDEFQVRVLMRTHA